MPDTATAPTMTAAQLRTVGTRLLGYYPGGGGAKVDGLVDTSMLGARDAAGLFQFDGIAGAPCALNVVPAASNQFGGIQVYTGGQHEMSLLAKGSTGEVNLSCGRSVGWGGHFKLIVDTVEAMRVTNNRRVGIGTSAPNELLEVAGNVQLSNGSNRYIQIGSATNFPYKLQGANDDFRVVSGSGATVLQITYPDYNLLGGSDNTQNLGHPSVRWATLFAGTGTINTCDVRFKTFRTDRQLREAEHAAALALFDAFGFYQFNDAIEAKGADGARWHFGPAAQEVYSIWADHDLCAALVENDKGELVPPPGAVPPAFMCFDLIAEETAPVTEGWRPSAVLGTDGQPVMVKCAEGEEATEQRPTGETIVTREAGHIFGVRIDQLHSIMLAALNAERKAQAAQIAELAARMDADAA